MRSRRRSRRAALVVLLTTTLCACGTGGSSDGGATPSPPLAPTPTALASTPQPTFAVTHAIVAEHLVGRGAVAAASDGDGFLIASVRGGTDGDDVLVGDRLDRSAARRDLESFTIATASDATGDLPNDIPTFDRPIAAFLDGAYQIGWYSERVVDQFPIEHTIFARRVERDGRVAPALTTIATVLSGFGFCQTTISGPLAGGAVADELVVLLGEGGACADNRPPIGIPELDALDPRTGAITYPPITPLVGVTGRELVSGLLQSTATMAAREHDALIEWFGGATGDMPPFVRGLWIENGAAVPVDVGAASTVATDGDGYLVVSTAVDPDDSGGQVIQVARFAADTHQLAPPATVVAGAGDVGRVRMVALAPDQYLLVHESLAEDGSASLDAHLVSVAGSAPTSVALGSFATGRFGGLATASGAGVALVAFARLEATEGTFAIETISAGVR
jgi:hypothetical protein